MDWTLTIDSASSSSTSASESLSASEVFHEEKVEEEEVEEEEESKITDIDALVEGSETEFDSSFTPFTLRWTYGRNVHVPFVNLTSENRKSIFYSAAHIGVLYDYEDKVMKFLQGHQNCITSIASDSSGKWIVTSDAGKDNVIIVWNCETCLPTCTIFDPHGEDGTTLVGMSPDATFLVSVSNSKDQIIACWKWTLGEKKPNGEFILPFQYGKIHRIVFCEDKNGDFMLTAESCVLFGIWEDDNLTVHIQEKPKSSKLINCKLCCSVYQNYSHYALTTTDTGHLLMWSDVPFSSVFNNEIPCNNNKTLLKTLVLDKESIEVIKAYKEIIITGNVSGELRFYDKMMKILYWVQSFQLCAITEINFHLWYEGSTDKLAKDGSCTISDRMDPFKPFYALEKAFERVLEKEKEKLAELRLLLKAAKKPEKSAQHPDEALIGDIIRDVLRDVEQWDVNETDKEELIQKIIKTAVDHVESKLSAALDHTEELIEGFLSSIFSEVDEDIPAKHSRDVAHAVMSEIMQSFDHKMDNNGVNEIFVRDVLEEMIDTVSIVEEALEKDDVDDSKGLTELVVENVFQAIEEKFAIDTQKVVELIVRNLIKDFEKKESGSQREIEQVEHEIEMGKHPKIFCRLKKIIEQRIEKNDELRIPSDATLERNPFVIGDFMISTVNGDIGLVNFINNTYTVILDKCVSPITALDCHVGKQQFAVGNASGSVILYNFIKTRTKVLETHLNSSEEERGVTAVKFAPSGFFLACGLADGSFWILDSSVLNPLSKTPHVHVDAPITQICISDDSLWIAHKDTEMRVCLYRCEDPSGAEIEFMGKQKSHFKPIRDLMFMRSLEDELHLYSLGEDRMLVEYDLIHSEADDLKILLIERIEQSAIPYCMTVYPKFGVENFILVANSEYKFKIFNDDSRLCRKTALGPRFEKPVSKIVILPKRQEKSQCMVYACEKHIGIQMLPLDGNPYKSVGMIGHPVKITHMDVYPRSKLLFTVGEGDHAVLMWTINTRAVHIMAHIGGEGLDPYYCLIEGGQNGWLYKEIQDFFYYAQILHEGENTTTERNVSHEIPLCEVPDLMRAIGYFPSEHEKYISFEDFVKLYLNHQPAFGTPFRKLQEAFEAFADDEDEEDGLIMYRETLISMLQERAECLSQEQVVKYLQVLLPSTQEPGESSSSSGSSEGSLWEFLPEDITYKAFVEDILGIRPPPKQKDAEKGKSKEKSDDIVTLVGGVVDTVLSAAEVSQEEILEEDEDKTEEEDECIDDFD
ncbi:WD repeat-containing protein [Gryllus bimaculatus]|nr:WD repeat-containing protein [Gryllus bimaculatus]